MSADAASQRGLPLHDQPIFRELRGRKRQMSIDKLCRMALRIRITDENMARVYHRSLPAPSTLATEDPSVDDALLANLIRIRSTKQRWEAAWHLRGDIRVAPDFPLVFVDGRFVPGSAAFYEDVLPSPIWRNYARRLFGQPTLRIDRAILLRELWDGNYWHLLHDTLPRLVMAEALELDQEIPLVVSQTLLDRFGKHLSNTTFLNGRKIIVQPQYHTLCCKELFLLRPGEFAAHWTRAMVDRVQPEPIATTNSRYIYCRRESQSSEGGRTAENSLEIEEMFQAAGFVSVDPASLTLGQQKALFEQAEVIAGINGAALANALFRCDKPLTIAALISSNWRSTTLPMMAKVFGFGYVGLTVAPLGWGFGDPMVVPRETASRLIDLALSRAAGHPR